MKDHIVREVINEVTKVAREFHATEQLRDRIRGAMEPLITAARGDSPDNGDAPRERAKSVKFKSQYGRGEAEYDSWFPTRSPDSLPVPVARFSPPCETCHGTGQNPAWPLSVCPQCGGTGKARASQ